MVAGEADLQSAAQRQPVDRRDERLAALLDAAQRQVSCIRSSKMASVSSSKRRPGRAARRFSSIDRSAPAMNAGFAEVTTTPFTLGSAMRRLGGGHVFRDRCLPTARSWTGPACPR